MPFLTFALWLLLLFALGWLALPLSLRLWAAREGENAGVFARGVLPDAGLAAGRMLLIVAWTLLVFWLGNSGIAIWWAVTAIFPLLGLIWWPMRLSGNRRHLRRVCGVHRRGILAGEITFLAIFLFFFALRGYWPGTGDDEKPMDMALISACARADSLPPADSYCAGKRLQSYYYLGHLQTAILTRAIGAQPRWTYNLMCATVPALCFSMLLSLCVAVARSWRGAIAAFCVLCLGTLSPLQQWGETPPGLATPRFWPVNHDATRAVIPYTLTEYPWSALQMSVLHAHLFAIPLGILLLCLCWALLRIQNAAESAGEKIAPKNHQRSLLLLACGLTLCAVILTNTWDFPGHWLLLLLCLLTTSWLQNNSFKRFSLPPRVLASGGVVAALALAGAAPFLLHLQTQAGKGLVAQPASPARPWLLVWALPLIAWLMALWLAQRNIAETQNDGDEKAANLIHRLAAIGGTIWGLLWLLTDQNHFVVALLVFLIAASGASAWQAAQQSNASTRDDESREYLARHAWLCGVAISGWACLLAAELFWSGFLGPPMHRINNVMKWGLQASILVGTAAACSAFASFPRARKRATETERNSSKASKKRQTEIEKDIIVKATPQWKAWPILTRFAVLFLLPASLCATAAMLCGRTRYFSNFEGWDGWSHIAPDERAAAQWIQNRARDGDVLVEAVDANGGDYTEYSRYANATGVSGVVGPRTHTFQWGTSWEEVERRALAVKDFYTAYDAAHQREILRKYRVKYIVCGALERRQYGNFVVANIERTFPHLFEAGEGENRVVVCAAD